jgi:hypothetical protein
MVVQQATFSGIQQFVVQTARSDSTQTFGLEAIGDDRDMLAVARRLSTQRHTLRRNLHKEPAPFKALHERHRLDHLLRHPGTGLYSVPIQENA